MDNELLHELATFLREASPVVWEAARRQVLSETIGGFIWGLLWLGCAVGCGFLARWLWWKWHDRSKDYELEILGFCLVVAVGAFFLLIALTLSMGAFGRIINPDFYAIKALLLLVR